MNLEVSTINVLLSVAIGAQAWILRELVHLKIRLTRIEYRLGVVDRTNKDEE